MERNIATVSMTALPQGLTNESGIHGSSSNQWMSDLLIHLVEDVLSLLHAEPVGLDHSRVCW